MIIIPNRTTKKITQNNRSKVLGDLWASFNLDLQSNLGVIKVSPRLQLNTGGVANQGLSVAFAAFDLKLWTIAGTRIFRASADNLTTAFTIDTSPAAQTDFSINYSDMTTFNDVLVATTATRFLSKDADGAGGGSWHQRGATFDNTASSHKLCYSAKTNRIYYIDSYSSIKSMDTSWSEATSGSYFISIPFKYGFIHTMDADSSDIWIATTKTNLRGEIDATSGASILRWDGKSDQITTEYKIKAKGVLALCKDDRNIIHAFTSDAQLLQFTGSGFEEIGRLPLNRAYLTNSIPLTLTSFVHPNGFYFTRNGTFIVNVNNLVGDSGGTVKENLPSGIWEFHKDTGFVHRQSLSYNPMATSTITDYGQIRVSAVGALYESGVYSESAAGKPTIICGATYYTDASNTSSGIFIDDPLDTVQKYGYFVTNWSLSPNLLDDWQKLALKYRQLLDSADRIWLKYRLRESAAVEISGTWAGLSPLASTFTTTTDLTGKVGYEVEVLQGTGGGKCAHIVSATNNAGTYTVVLDEPFTGTTTGTFKARVQAWKKCTVITDQITEAMIKTIAEATAMRIQIKCCMQFTGEDEVYELGVINTAFQPLA